MHGFFYTFFIYCKLYIECFLYVILTYSLCLIDMLYEKGESFMIKKIKFKTKKHYILVFSFISMIFLIHCKPIFNPVFNIVFQAVFQKPIIGVFKWAIGTGIFLIGDHHYFNDYGWKYLQKCREDIHENEYINDLIKRINKTVHEEFQKIAEYSNKK